MQIRYFFPPMTARAVRVGWLVSFTGSLPPGVVTIGVFQTGTQGGFSAALAFSLGAVVVEAIVVWMSLTTTAWLLRRQKWLDRLDWISLLMMGALFAGAIWAAFQQDTTPRPALVLPAGLNAFWGGALVRMLTPTLLPYWMGWNTTLFARKVLHPHSGQYRAYIGAVATGTLMAHSLFIGVSQVASRTLPDVQKIANWLIMIVLSAGFVLMAFKISKKAQANTRGTAA
jgi:threonine/homoserine/homoserine lactone efflux protein